MFFISIAVFIEMLIRTNLNITKSFMGVFASFLFATLGGYLYYTIYLRYKDISFYSIWWKAYGIMNGFSIISRMTFGEL